MSVTKVGLSEPLGCLSTGKDDPQQEPSRRQLVDCVSTLLFRLTEQVTGAVRSAVSFFTFGNRFYHK